MNQIELWGQSARGQGGAGASRMRRKTRKASAALVVALAGANAAWIAPAARASDAFSTYGSGYRAISMPPLGTGSFGYAGDAMADGSLLVVTGNSVYRESAAGSGSFALVATIDADALGGISDPGFLRVSPSGSRIAIGGGFAKAVAVFDVAALGTDSSPRVIDEASASFYGVRHFDGAWSDDRHLALTAGDFGSPGVVTLLDTASAAGEPVNPEIIRNIGGASAGIAFDSEGRLYTGNGFDGAVGGSAAGWIKAFEPSAWGSGDAADFESEGVLIADALSASPLRFDAEGNLFAGGGDFDEFDVGYAAVIRRGAIEAALGGAGPADRSDALEYKRLDPLGSGFGYFGVGFNPVTMEAYVTDGATWYATVPGPGGGVVCVAVLAAGSVRRRSRHAR